MRFTVRYTYRDYTGREGTTGFDFEGVESFATLDTLILSAESVLSAMIDTPVYKAIATSKLPSTTGKLVTGTGSAYHRLLFLCTNGSDYAKITIPAPSALATVNVGPFSGYKVDLSDADANARLSTLHSYLATTVTPSGEPFPVGEFAAAYLQGDI